MHARLVAVALLLGSGTVAAAEQPDLSGVWKLNPSLSQDAAEKIKAAAGPESMSGNLSWATDTWIPWAGGFSEGQRVGLRELLLAAVAALQTVEIEQGAEEVKTLHGEAGARIFNLKRASAGTSALGEETVTRQARWQGSQLVLETKGKEGRFWELLTLVPARNQLTYALRLEHKLLEAPLELSLVYDRGGSR
jgi:hypothetical protein